MSVTKSEMKEEARKRMNMLKFSPEVIRAFTESGEVYLSMNGVLYSPDSETEKRIQKFEEETKGVVYHMIYNRTNIGNLLTFLYVSAYPEEWKRDCKDLKNGCPLAYVINEDDERFSEFGSVGIETYGGSIIRTS